MKEKLEYLKDISAEEEKPSPIDMDYRPKHSNEGSADTQTHQEKPSGLMAALDLFKQIAKGSTEPPEKHRALNQSRQHADQDGSRAVMHEQPVARREETGLQRGRERDHLGMERREIIDSRERIINKGQRDRTFDDERRREQFDEERKFYHVSLLFTGF